MGRTLGPERAHFGGEDGLITLDQNGKLSHYWRCNFCGFSLGGKVFPNSKARIHLSGDESLRSGLISKICSRAPDKIKKQFQRICNEKNVDREARLQSRKRAAELLKSNEFSSPAKQTRLSVGRKNLLSSEQVDLAWGKAFFGLDIAINKIDKDWFRDAIEATKMSNMK